MSAIRTIFLGYFLYPLLTLVSIIVLLPVSFLARLVLLFKQKILSKFTQRKLQNILITGASSGIGEALAYEYANLHQNKTYTLHLHLSGRDSKRLEQVKNKISALKNNVQVHPKIINVADEAAMRSWISEADTVTPAGLDLVVANAGASPSQLLLQNPEITFEEQTREMVSCHIQGALNTILPAITLFQKKPKENRNQQLAITSSIAGEAFLFSGVYGCAKIFQAHFVRSMRAQIGLDNIHLSVILPGWVESRMADAYTASKPLIISAEEAAKTIVTGLECNDAEIVAPSKARVFSPILWWPAFSVWEPLLQLRAKPDTTFKAPKGKQE